MPTVTTLTGVTNYRKLIHGEITPEEYSQCDNSPVRRNLDAIFKQGTDPSIHTEEVSGYAQKTASGSNAESTGK